MNCYLTLQSMDIHTSVPGRHLNFILYQKLIIPQKVMQPQDKLRKVENYQVYDYDWGLRDDFIGEASLPLGQLVPQKRNDLVLTLAETGKDIKTKQIMTASFL